MGIIRTCSPLIIKNEMGVIVTPAPEPPPKEAAPTPSSENPIEVTTTAATMGVMIRRHQRANKPSSPSMRPPTMTAPTSAP